MIQNRLIDRSTEVGRLREKVWIEALEWINTPWVHHQMTKYRGADCLGTVAGVGVNSNVVEFDWKSPKAQKFKGYGRSPNPEIMRAGMETFLVHIPDSEMNIGDILWFRVIDEPQHVGILGPGKSLLHADMRPRPKFPGGKVICSAIDKIQGAKLIAVFRYPEIHKAQEQWLRSA